MSYCRIHGAYEGDGCSDCREALEQAQTERAEIAEKLDELHESQLEAHSDYIHAINNPGDYNCPYCKLRSLKGNASRCPKCHGEIESNYWEEVWVREAQLRKRREQEQAAARIEWERKQLERKKQECAKQEQKRLNKLILHGLIYFLYLVPAASILIPFFIWQWDNPITENTFGGAVVGSLLPFLNWELLYDQLNQPDHGMSSLPIYVAVVASIGAVVFGLRIWLLRKK